MLVKLQITFQMYNCAVLIFFTSTPIVRQCIAPINFLIIRQHYPTQNVSIGRRDVLEEK